MKELTSPSPETNSGNVPLALDLPAALNAPIRYWIRVRNPEPPAKPTHSPRCSDPDLVYLSPKQVARMWGISHDKILAFIRTGELSAFNVAAESSRRPRYKITLSAVKQFEEGHSGRDTAKVQPTSRRRRQRSRSTLPAAKKYF